MALYRKYRPATFAEIVGQEHVTEPLSAALEAGRINHAYLFSGPRGCGKTSSARILARSLNCVQGPTGSPCGTCNSCVALGPGGAGNLDVIELDAASHGGVEDTRDLRDKAFYAPAESRYRVFIIDEAHMVTTAGFNALLKIVEEPPEHLIFIFATTEPEKVLPTIRSRTHHYPFRLLPPTVMRGLLDNICAQEQVLVEDAVFPLVIRAGGGSPRDSLSVLDQLLAGAGPEGITYPRALSLLGVTDVALIDDTVDALAVNDGAALFETVNRLVEAGHDPRRFASDLLERFRDLILMQAVPDAGERGMVDAPVDVLARMRAEVDRIGPATLTRYAEIVHDGLGEMRGATAPRLLLEVMCARMLLPGASEGQAALMQRLEKLERGIPAVPAGAAAPVPVPSGSGPASAAPEAEPAFVRPSQRAAQEAAAKAAAPAPVVPAPVDSAPVDSAPVPSAPVAAEPAVAEPVLPVEPVVPVAEALAVEPVPAAVPEPVQPVAAEPVAPVEVAAPVEPVPPAVPVATAVPVAPVAPAVQAPPESVAAPEPEPAPVVESVAPATAMPDGPGPAGPSDKAPPAPVATPEPVAAAYPDLKSVQDGWSTVRRKARELSTPVVEAMLSGATVRVVSESTVGISHESPQVADRLVEPHNSKIIEQALADVFSHNWTLSIVKDTGPAPAAGPPPQTRAAQAAPPKVSTGFKRPSQSPDYEPAEPEPAPVAPAARPEPRTTPPIVITRPSQEGVQPAPAAAPEYPEDLPPEPDLPEDVDDASTEDEMLAEAAAGPGEQMERRDPEIMAIELLEAELGAVRLEE